jgi:YidC/Oxa1 family membrane protein insertase
MMLYVFPFGVVVGGIFLPLAIIFYWFANNIWTFGQQHYVFGNIEKEEEAKKVEALERRAANAPKPGAKPGRQRKTEPGPTDSTVTDAVEITDAPDAVIDGKPTQDTSRPGATPRPGARPKKRKR